MDRLTELILFVASSVVLIVCIRNFVRADRRDKIGRFAAPDDLGWEPGGHANWPSLEDAQARTPRVLEINWEQLDQAYGNARRVPEILAALASEDEDVRRDAIFGGLYSALSHQYAIYSATPHAIPFVIEIISGATREDQEELIGFIRTCARGSHQISGVSEAIASHLDVFRELAESDLGERANADLEWLCEYCTEAVNR